MVRVDTVLHVMRRVQMKSYYRQAVIKVSSHIELRKPGSFFFLYIRNFWVGKNFISVYHLFLQAAQSPEFPDGFMDGEAFERLFDELDKEHIKEVVFSALRKLFV